MRFFTEIIILLAACAGAMADTHYVAPPGVGVNPSGTFTNWNIAATSIIDAVNAASNGDTVLVSNGVYYLTNQVYVSTSIRVSSWNNGDLDRDGTVVNGHNYNGKLITNRCFYLNNASAVVEGLTITNGRYMNSAWQDCGAGVRLAAGTLRYCLVTGNIQTNNQGWVSSTEEGGGGIYAHSANSMITNCDIFGNYSYIRGGGIFLTAGAQMWNCRVMFNAARGTMGGGIAMPSGYLYNSIIVSNIAASTATYGGGIGMREQGVVRNCLIMANVSSNSIGGGIGTWGGSGDTIVENCTIVTNIGRGIYKGFWTRTTHFRNTIVYDNTVGQFSDTSGGYYSFTNCCIPQTGLIGSGNITNQEPRFADAPGRDYHLKVQSPCANSGLNQDWMVGFSDLDGRSRRDRFSGVVDMGCYEYLPHGVIFKLY